MNKEFREEDVIRVVPLSERMAKFSAPWEKRRARDAAVLKLLDRLDELLGTLHRGAKMLDAQEVLELQVLMKAARQ